MFCLKILPSFLSLLGTVALVNPLIAQLSEEVCDNLINFGKFYNNPDASTLQSAKLFLSYQHQIGHIDGTDQTGKEFDDSFEEFRRVWVGLSGKFGNFWKFKVVSQSSMKNQKKTTLSQMRMPNSTMKKKKRKLVSQTNKN